jgi:hypothetical protein
MNRDQQASYKQRAAGAKRGGVCPAVGNFGTFCRDEHRRERLAWSKLPSFVTVNLTTVASCEAKYPACLLSQGLTKYEALGLTRVLPTSVARTFSFSLLWTGLKIYRCGDRTNVRSVGSPGSGRVRFSPKKIRRPASRYCGTSRQASPLSLTPAQVGPPSLPVPGIVTPRKDPCCLCAFRIIGQVRPDKGTFARRSQ